MDFQQGFNQEQLMMIDFESMVSADLFVDNLPLKELGFNDVLADEGRPPFHSSDLLKRQWGLLNTLMKGKENVLFGSQSDDDLLQSQESYVHFWR